MTKKELEIKKAFGGCEKCYGKGYSTQMVRGSGKMTKSFIAYRPCTCLRGIGIHKMIQLKRQLGRETMYNDAYSLVPEFIDKNFPKGKSKDRGAATVHIALFLAYLKKQV